MSLGITEFKYACKEYLSSLNIFDLRTCCRHFGVSNPTEKKKSELLEEVVAILAGEQAPAAPSKKGAPVKSEHLDPEILKTIKQYKEKYLAVFHEKTWLQKLREEAGLNPILRVESPAMPEPVKREYSFGDPVYRGQLETIDNVSFLLPLDCSHREEPFIVPIETIREYALREGDIVSCGAMRSENALVASTVLTINETRIEDFKRVRFEETAFCDETTPLLPFDEGFDAFDSAKYAGWLAPLYEGERYCIAASPKSGKTELLYRILHGLQHRKRRPYVLAYLCGQTPEAIAKFRGLLGKDGLIYSTYEDEPERQVFLAEFLLRRAKRLAESGQEVILAIDSVNALARAYNETKESAGGKVLAGGLESKTLLYLKRYFSAARKLENSGSLTVVWTLAENTGNPMDDLLSAEMCSVSNTVLRLSESLARERIYPAIDLQASRIVNKDSAIEELERYTRSVFLPRHGEVELRRLIKDAQSREELFEKMKNQR